MHEDICPAPPGEFEDDGLHALWVVEHRASRVGVGRPLPEWRKPWWVTKRMTWDDAESFVDELFVKYEPENIEVVISRVE